MPIVYALLHFPFLVVHGLYVAKNRYIEVHTQIHYFCGTLTVYHLTGTDSNGDSGNVSIC